MFANAYHTLLTRSTKDPSAQQRIIQIVSGVGTLVAACLTGWLGTDTGWLWLAAVPCITLSVIWVRLIRFPVVKHNGR